MKNRKMTLIIGCIIFTVYIFFVLISQKTLSKNGVLLQAHTLNWAASAKMGMNLRYEFYYKNEKKTGSNSFEKIRGLVDFENKSFPVMYDPKLGASQLLIEPLDFKRFNLSFPDSLNWVLPYLR